MHMHMLGVYISILHKLNPARCRTPFLDAIGGTLLRIPPAQRRRLVLGSDPSVWFEWQNPNSQQVPKQLSVLNGDAFSCGLGAVQVRFNRTDVLTTQ